jgi:phosphoribosylformylglycinamidine synthase
VAEAARNVACAGAIPIGATNCLNFGNPERPEIMGQLVRSIQGIGEACRALDVPITGGNVSLYNETDGRAIYPTPVLGVVGLIQDVDATLASSFGAEGDAVYLLGATGEDLGGTEFLEVVHRKVAGRPPRLDLDAEKRLLTLLAEGAARGVLRSAHDPSDGGLAVALAESCFRHEQPHLGGRFDLPAGLRPDVLLFAESPSRAVVTTRDDLRMAELARRHGVPWARIGVVAGERLVLSSAGRTLVDLPLATLHEAWMSLERQLGEPALDR